MSKQHGYQMSLRIVHPAVTPSSITKQLGLKPTASWKEGDPRRTPKGKNLGGVRDSSYWCTRLRARRGEDIAAFVVRALERLAKHRTFIVELVSSGGRVSLYVTGNVGRMAEVFELSMLTRLVEMKCALEIETFEGL